MLPLQNGFLSGTSRRAQRGVTLLELIVVIGLLASVMTGLAKWSDMYVESTKETVAGQHMATVGDAANAYLKDNYATVSAAATATTPVLITVDMLRTTGYLQNGFSATNNFGQTLCVLVLKPSGTTLLGLVVSEGGTAVADLDLGNVAVAIGAPGGGIYSTATTTITGAMGGWTTPVGSFANANASGKKCDGVTAGTPTLAAGHPVMALWFANGDPSSAFLYRNSVPGHTELNTMNTPILMGASTVQTAGAACTTNGAVGRDTNGGLLSCTSGVWKGGAGGLNWKGSVASIAALPASGNASGDAYRITNLSDHVFVWDAQHNVWQGMVVDGSGNLSLPGMIYTAGSSSSYGAITMQGSKNGYSGINFKDAAGNNSGTLMMSPSYSGFFNAADGAWRWYVDNSGNSIQSGNAAAGTLQVNTAVAEGSACSPDGKIAKSSATSGLILSCQSGVWKALGASALFGTFTSGGHALNTAYTNSTGKPIFVSVVATSTATPSQGGIIGYVNGAQASYAIVNDANSGMGWLNSPHSVSMIVPPGATYQVNRTLGTIALSSWTETY